MRIGLEQRAKQVRSNVGLLDADSSSNASNEKESMRSRLKQRKQRKLRAGNEGDSMRTRSSNASKDGYQMRIRRLLSPAAFGGIVAAVGILLYGVVGGRVGVGGWKMCDKKDFEWEDGDGYPMPHCWVRVHVLRRRLLRLLSAQ